MPSLLNVLALLILVFFIFSVLGVFLFSGVTEGLVLNNNDNFHDFGSALILLFRIAGGE